MIHSKRYSTASTAMQVIRRSLDILSNSRMEPHTIQTLHHVMLPFSREGEDKDDKDVCLT